MGTVEKLLAGTGLLIALYLVASNPAAVAVTVQSLTAAYTSGVKSLQGR